MSKHFAGLAAPQSVWGSRRLWSLWDIMEAFDAGRLVETVHRLACAVSIGTDDKAPLTPHWRAAILKDFEELLAECEKLGLVVPTHQCHTAIKLLKMGGHTGETGAVARLAAMVSSNIHIEMDVRKYFALLPEKARFYEPKDSLFGKDFETKFPSAVFEIDECGKCLAFERPTAAVFHLMRIMEIGVRAVARCLGIPDPLKPAERNWGFILGAVKKGIDTRWPTTADRHAGDGSLFEDVYASLDAVRNPWRNATMHVENKYTPEEAEHIFVAVRGFMKKLASRTDEDGQPPASRKQPS
jgi:hypothetical protein